MPRYAKRNAPPSDKAGDTEPAPKQAPKHEKDNHTEQASPDLPAAPHDELMNVLDVAHQPSTTSGRPDLRKFVKEFLESNISARKSASLYLSGTPGTGKTLTCRTLLNTLPAFKSQAQGIYINCMATGAENLYGEIIRNLERSPSASERLVDTLDKELLRTDKPMVVVLLDEVDALLSSNSIEVYHIFELTSMPNSRLIVVCIANLLDMTVRFLPRLKTMKVKPVELEVKTYAPEDLEAIGLERLREAKHEKFFGPGVIKYCANKVASQSGDARKLLELLKLVVGKAKVKGHESVDLDTLLPILKDLEPSLLKSIATLPQLLACVLCVCCVASKSSTQVPLVSAVHVAYANCRKKARLMPMATPAQINDALMNLETLGLLSIESTKNARELSRKRVVVQVGVTDVHKELANGPLATLADTLLI